MPFVTRRQVALASRIEAEKKYRAQLRRALSTPGLSAEQQEDLRRRINQVGKPRVYDANSPPPPGAIALVPPEPEFTMKGLLGSRKAELVGMARERGLATSGSKAALASRLLDSLN